MISISLINEFGDGKKYTQEMLVVLILKQFDQDDFDSEIHELC